MFLVVKQLGSIGNIHAVYWGGVRVEIYFFSLLSYMKLYLL